jgi:zinc D-Ala-D-Ala dipeptidase
MRRRTALLLPALLLLHCASAPAGPPVEPGKKAADLVELTSLEPGLRLDVRYATANNFVGRPVYTEARAFLQRPAAEALVRAHRRLATDGYGLVVFDAYRPWSVTKLFWEVTPKSKKAFVADPRKGSKHNRGAAADVGLYALATGAPVPMPSDYDDFTERAHPTFAGGTAEQRAARDLLRRAMEAEGFTIEPNEWWHFNYAGWQDYPILDVPFAALSAAAGRP